MASIETLLFIRFFFCESLANIHKIIIFLQHFKLTQFRMEIRFLFAQLIESKLQRNEKKIIIWQDPYALSELLLKLKGIKRETETNLTNYKNANSTDGLSD